MNPMEILLNHKTIRKYKKQTVNPGHMVLLLDVAKRAATSMGLQHYSIVRVTDPERKRILATEICKQDYIADVPEVLIFVVDCFRNRNIAAEQEIDVTQAGDADRFFQGWTDACLAAQQMVCAAELAGYGTMYMGSILNDAPRVIELLGLPELTFPVVGLGIGMPDQRPQLKPRMGRECNVFENEYKVFPSYLQMMEEYDAEMEEYYDARFDNRPSDTFTVQVAQRMLAETPKRAQLIAQAKAQGFRLE